MSFNIGQYRGIISEPSSNLSTKIETITVTNDDNITYKNTCINYQFLAGTFYYLQVQILRGEAEKTITVQLQGEEDASSGDNLTFVENNQIIERITVPPNFQSDKPLTSTYSFIINPVRNFDKIVFVLSRNFAQQIEAEVTITINKFYPISNLLNNFSSNGAEITQLGVHAAPGTLMCINGEPIRIGKRGVFELNDTSIIRITFINIVSNIGTHYIIDYRYTKEE